jgi:hypothetical protein
MQTGVTRLCGKRLTDGISIQQPTHAVVDPHTVQMLPKIQKMHAQMLAMPAVLGQIEGSSCRASCSRWSAAVRR